MAPPPFVGLCLALAAAGGNNLGKGLQKAATRTLPQLNLGRSEVVLAYLCSPTWLLGLLLDVGGGAAMLGALAAAPVSLVQPVAAFGLVLLAGFSHFVLQERLTSHQWRGAAVATLGIIGMGISSSGSSGSSSSSAALPTTAAAGQQQQQQQPPAAAGAGEGGGDAAGAASAAAAAAAAAVPSPARALCCLLLLLVLLGLEVVWRQQRQVAAAARRKRAGAAAGVGVAAAAEAAAAASDAAACGLEAGCCFGFSAAAARTGFELSKTLGWLIVPVGLAASVSLTSSGFVLQTRGFKHGSAIVVCTTAAAASIVAGVLVGLVALSEPLPASPRMRLLLVASWVAVFAGISSMAGTGNDITMTSLGAAADHKEHSSSGGGSGSSVAAAVYGRAAEIVRELLRLVLPRSVRRRVLPRKTQQWLGRSGSGSGLGLWQALTGHSRGAGAAVLKGGGVYEEQPGLASGGSESLGVAGGLGMSEDGGPLLPVSRSTPDFANVLAPMGGARF